MSVAETMVKLAELPVILKAAQVLERNNLLLHGESTADVVKRYIEANPDILAHSLRQAAPDNDLPEKALDYLRRKGLQGSPLRKKT